MRAVRCARELAGCAAELRRQASEASAIAETLVDTALVGADVPARSGEGRVSRRGSPLTDRLRAAMASWREQFALSAEALHGLASRLDQTTAAMPARQPWPPPLSAIAAARVVAMPWPVVTAVASQPTVALEPAGVSEPNGVILLIPDELAVCAARLRSVSGRAEALERAVAGSMGRAEQVLRDAATPPPITPMSVEVLRETTGRGLRVASVGAFAAAVDLEGRLVRLADGPFASRPTPAGAGSALAIAAGLLAAVDATTSGRSRGRSASATLRATRAALAGLPPVTRAAVISQLRGAGLAALGAQARRLLAASSRLADPSELGTVAQAIELAGLADDLLASAPREMIDELVRALPWLEPAPPTVPATWSASLSPAPRPATPPSPAPRPAGTPSAPVWADRSSEPLVRDGIGPDDVGQGTVPDCYLAAALVGFAAQDPDRLATGIRRNPNGTATVTLHPGADRGDGATPTNVTPTNITVTANLAQGLVRMRRDGPVGRQELAVDADNADGRGELWPALYEKAFARLRGGYPALGYGSTVAALSTLTGHRASWRDARRIGSDDLAAALGEGEVVLVTTRERTRPAGLVAAHAYAVLAVDSARGQVLLRNPWDPSAGETNERWYDWTTVRGDVRTVVRGATR